MNVYKIPISKAVPGMITAADVYTKDDHLIMAKGTKLTDKIIARLIFYSVLDLEVYDSADTLSEDLSPAQETYYEKIKKSPSFQRFYMAYKNVNHNMKSVLDEFAINRQEIDIERILSEINQILDRCSSGIELFNMLYCLRKYDDATYVHSVNVALICNIIGRWLHFNPADLEVITLCGMLHDIGKLMVPNDLITKPDKLTEEEYSRVKAHTIRGYHLLKNQKIDSRIKRTALLHHERCDGSGYPYGFHSGQIEPFARLVAIADVFDAMTSSRVYRGPLCPFIVVSIFETEGFSKYDPNYMLPFMEGIIQTYINNDVILSNNQVGKIVLINKLELSKPVIAVGNQFIDLAKKRDLYITSLV